MSSPGPIENILTQPEALICGHYLQRVRELNEELGKNKPYTFFMRVNSGAMTQAGIGNGDIVVVDRSMDAVSGKIVVASIDGNLLLRRYDKQNNKVLLAAEAGELSTIEVEAGSDHFAIWGVVTFVIRAMC